MPIKTPAVSNWADPGNDSVFESPFIRMARKAVNGLGLADPTSQIFGMAAPTELPFEGAAEAAAGVGKSVASPLLEKIFSSNPLAREVYERAMKSQLGQAIAEKYAAKEAKGALISEENGALQKLLAAEGPTTERTSQGLWMTENKPKVYRPQPKTPFKPGIAQDNRINPSLMHVTKFGGTE
jgi:hypothetical protein